jgi:hypothetical protein
MLELINTDLENAYDELSCSGFTIPFDVRPFKNVL